MLNDAKPEPSRIRLDDLANEQLPPATNDSLLKIAVEQVEEWEETNFGLRIVTKDGTVLVDGRARFGVKKALTILGSICGGLWVVTQLLFPQLAILMNEVMSRSPSP